MSAKTKVRIDPFFLHRTAAKSVRRALETGGDIGAVSRLIGIGAMTAAEAGALPLEDALREAGSATLREAARAGAAVDRAAGGLVDGVREGARRAGRDPVPLLAAFEPGAAESRYPPAFRARNPSRITSMTSPESPRREPVGMAMKGAGRKEGTS